MLGADTMRIAARSEKTYDLVYSPMLTRPIGGQRSDSCPRSSESLGTRSDSTRSTRPRPWCPRCVPRLAARAGPPCWTSRTPWTRRFSSRCRARIILATLSSRPPSATAPFGVGKFRVTYAPSSLNQLETGTIVVTNEEAGTWTWSVSGRGAEPTKLPATDIFATLGQTGSGSVSFQNPFHEPIYVDVAIETDEDAGVWEDILKKRQGVHVDGFQVVPIPFLAFARDDPPRGDHGHHHRERG